MRFVLYARKSSESEDRQVQSIDDQVTVLRAVATQRSLTVIDEITESKSAKDPGQRPKFDHMLRLIERGRAEGILCWNVNRLSRNPIDSGKLAWLLQQGTLKSIQTPERCYLPEDNVLLFSVETGMANQYILDLKRAVKRGMDSKIAKGWFPFRAPEGYINNLRDHTIEMDPERFALLQRAWRLVIGGATVSEALRQLNEDWGYRSRPKRGYGGRELSRATAYRMFTNVFYTGYFETAGRTYKGQHPPMVTLDEFRQVQQHVRRQIGKSHFHKHAFAYSGLIRCARCGHGVTAELQRGYRQRGQYIYYHCNNTTGNCSKRGVREELVEGQIDGCLRQITITPAFAEIVRDELTEWIKQELGGQVNVYNQQARSLSESTRMLDELLDMRLRHLLDDTRYREKEAELHNRILDLSQAVERTKHRMDRAREIIDNAMEFRMHAREHFLVGDKEKRRQIARALGCSFSFDQGKICIHLNPLLEPIQRVSNDHPSTSIELPKTPISRSKLDVCAPNVSFGSPDETDSERLHLRDHWHPLFRKVADNEIDFACPWFDEITSIPS
jgi:DNA invertase Pin-like site-specific DNA recombinase